MTWIPFISSVARLIDLHDSGHLPGSVPVFGRDREDRTGRNNGLWLDVGICVLEYLRDADAGASGAFISINSLVEHIRHRHNNLSDDDVRYVITVLSTPSIFYYLSPEDSDNSLRSTKETALIERSRQADMCRLSKMGRISVSLAHGYKNFAYTEGDATKIISAIKWNNFDDVPKACAGIVQKLIGLGQEITHATELAGRDDILNEFDKNYDNYINTLKNINEIISKATEILSLQETIDRFFVWQESNNSNLTLSGLSASLDRVSQVLERLQRKFSAFIETVHTYKRTAVDTIYFDRLSSYLIDNPPSQNILGAILKTHAPLNATFAFIDPSDFKGILAQKVYEETVDEVVFDDSGVEVQTLDFGEFNDKYREEIIAELSRGPLSITMAIDRGWFKVNDKMKLGHMFGVFSVPASLNTSGVIHTFLNEDVKFIKSIPGKGNISGEDVMLELWREEDKS